MDIVGRFIEDRCFVADYAKVESTQLYEAYKQWCDENGEEATSQKRLAQRLQERALRNDTRSEVTNRIQWIGIGLLK
jgi:putative DNA primase/helicase